MSLFDIIYNLFIGPIELVFEIIFSMSYKITVNPGVSIIFLSLSVNFIVLPLYNKADKIQSEAQRKELALAPWVKHIKQTFSGDERQMILQTYYRQNNYKPIDSLKGSLPLLLEIPFFIAAYRFLSKAQLLEGISFGPITNLASPDNIISLFSYNVNALPLLMTLINLLSCEIYSIGLSKKNKAQMYGMAFVFLVLLYNSPSGLVLYWTLNNVFSLIKNYLAKKNKQSSIYVLLIFGLAILDYYALNSFSTYYAKQNRLIFAEEISNTYIYCLAIAFSIQIVAICLCVFSFITKKRFINISEQSLMFVAPNIKSFMSCAIVNFLLVGILIPSNLIKSSPTEFASSIVKSPMIYIVNASILAFGLFVIWFSVFYFLSSNRVKVVFENFSWCIAAVSFTNYFMFGNSFGNMTNMLKYERDLSFSNFSLLINLLSTIIVFLIAYMFWIKKNRLVVVVCTVVGVASIIVSIYNVFQIKTQMSAENNVGSMGASIVLDTKKENVVVIMLDRAISAYVPYVFYEHSNIAKQFCGFTYYPNTVSFGGSTNIATPALYGGYEYAPMEMNGRKDETLESKHNEALKVLPTIFAKNGFKATVFDPPYAGYSIKSDLSIFDDCKGVDAYKLKGMTSIERGTFDLIQKRILLRNVFCYSIFRTMPYLFGEFFYDDGCYGDIELIARNEGRLFSSDSGETSVATAPQIIQGVHNATGVNRDFMDSYSELLSLVGLTKTTDDVSGSFVFMDNELTHEAMLLQEPDCEPSAVVDNVEYDNIHKLRYRDNGDTIKLETLYQYQDYQTITLALRLIGNWLDYLREINVYDNTRIIIVSDHGASDGQFPEYKLNEDGEDIMRYNALLMVKDFNSNGEFEEDNSFMTNADVAYLSLNNLIEDKRNPFTGNDIIANDKNNVLVSTSYYADVNTNNGNMFKKSDWYYVKENVFDKGNWELIKE